MDQPGSTDHRAAKTNRQLVNRWGGSVGLYSAVKVIGMIKNQQNPKNSFPIFYNWNAFNVQTNTKQVLSGRNMPDVMRM